MYARSRRRRLYDEQCDQIGRFVITWTTFIAPKLAIF